MGVYSENARTNWRAEAALVFITLVWGATFVLVKSALADVSTLLFLALRFSLAALVLAIAYRGRLAGRLGRGKSMVKGGLLAGFFLFGGYVFQTLGLRFTTPSKSAFLTGLMVVLVPLLGAAVYRVAPRLSEGLGVSIAAVGMGLLTMKGASFSVNPGDLLTVVGAFAFALHVLTVGHYSREAGFAGLAVVQVAMAAALAVSTFWWAEPVHIRWTPTLAAALVVTGLLATALAFTVQAWAQQHTTATRTVLIFALEPVFAWATSYLATGEVLGARSAVGAGLILTGIILVELKPLGAVRPIG
jgi:drug/metabolite transporter (DMT)-like permease